MGLTYQLSFFFFGAFVFLKKTAQAVTNRSLRTKTMVGAPPSWHAFCYKSSDNGYRGDPLLARRNYTGGKKKGKHRHLSGELFYAAMRLCSIEGSVYLVRPANKTKLSQTLSYQGRCFFVLDFIWLKVDLRNR